jgi:uncharacterized protein (DUF58 family)
VLAGAAGLVAAVASGRPEPAALAAPLLVAAVLGVTSAGRPEPSLTAALAADRLAEGDATTLRLQLGGSDDPVRVLVAPAAPPALRIEPAGPLRLDRERRDAVRAVRAVRWGAHRIPPLRVREVLDPAGFLVRDSRVAVVPADLRVYPTPRALRRMVAPLDTSLASGSHVARTKAPGVEFADVRPYAPGDRVREVNWRATARRRTLWVNERHPDRSADVVVFLDAFVEEDLARAVPAADAVVRATLRRRDRVGLVSFGGTVRWVSPGAGLRQQYLVVDALLATTAFASAAWRDLAVLPPRVLPPSALVVAVSSLRDPRGVAALWDLRSRGADLAVLEVEPAHPPASPTSEDGLAGRLWSLRRDVARDRFLAVGVPVARWAPGSPLAVAVEELTSWPHRAKVRR